MSDDSPRCSFCHKGQDVVKTLISSPSDATSALPYALWLWNGPAKTVPGVGHLVTKREEESPQELRRDGRALVRTHSKKPIDNRLPAASLPHNRAEAPPQRIEEVRGTMAAIMKTFGLQTPLHDAV